MVKKLFILMILSIVGKTGLFAQDVIKGYFRIQNGYGITGNSGQNNDKGYVQVTDLLWAAPNQTVDQVKTEAGSVIYVNAIKQADGRYKIVNLRSQGVEVVGGEQRKDYNDILMLFKNQASVDKNAILRQMIDEGYLRWGRSTIEAGLAMVAAVLDQNKSNTEQDATTLTDGFNRAVSEDMDIDMYLTPTTLSNGTTAYLLNEHTLKLQNVSDYVAAHSTQFGYAFESMRNLMKAQIGRTGEDIQAADIELLNKIGYPYPDEYKINSYQETDGSTTYALTYEYIFARPELLFYWLKLNMYKFLTTTQFDNAIKAFGGDNAVSYVTALRSVFPGTFENYFNRIHWDTDYFLIDGTVSNGTIEGTPGATYTYMGRFGIANNNTDLSYYPSEIVTANDGAKWVMKEVDANDNYFGVTANAKLQGRDGKYYTTLYVDFPIDVQKSQAVNSSLRFWNISGNAQAANVILADGTTKQYYFLPIEEFTDYVPKGTPVVVETNATDAASNKMIPSATDEAMNKTVTSALKGTFFNVSKTNASDSYGTLIEQVVQKLFGYTDLKTELAARYGIEGVSNIYTLNKNSADTQNPMGFYLYSGTSLTANKAFLTTQDVAMAKIYLGELKNSTTGIDGVQNDMVHQDNILYDLQGRRVYSPAKGIYILNGKKVLMR